MIYFFSINGESRIIPISKFLLEFKARQEDFTTQWGFDDIEDDQFKESKMIVNRFVVFIC